MRFPWQILALLRHCPVRYFSLGAFAINWLSPPLLLHSRFIGLRTALRSWCACTFKSVSTTRISSRWGGERTRGRMDPALFDIREVRLAESRRSSICFTYMTYARSDKTSHSRVQSRRMAHTRRFLRVISLPAAKINIRLTKTRRIARDYLNYLDGAISPSSFPFHLHSRKKKTRPHKWPHQVRVLWNRNVYVTVKTWF